MMPFLLTFVPGAAYVVPALHAGLQVPPPPGVGVGIGVGVGTGVGVGVGVGVPPPPLQAPASVNSAGTLGGCQVSIEVYPP